MKKLSIIMMLAFVCGSFAMAQTSNVAKKATLMPDGAVVTDVKTGEVVRTTKGSLVLPGNINGSLSIIGGSNPSNAEPLKRIKSVQSHLNQIISQPPVNSAPNGVKDADLTVPIPVNTSNLVSPQ